MNYEEIKRITETIKKGRIATINYEKQLKTLKGVEDIITKETTAQVRLGIKYDNIGRVKNAREDGLLPAENAGLPKNTKWDIPGYTIKNTTTGGISLRVARAHGNKTENIYRKNGVIVDKSEIQHLCYSNEFPTYKEGQMPPEVFNIGIEKIKSIK